MLAVRTKPQLYFCCGDNRRFAEIALSSGLGYGARLPARLYFPIQFADQDWENPDLPAYVAALRQHTPQIATVLDWVRYEQFEEVMEWATEAARIVQTVIIIPKIHNVISMIPDRIGDADVRLGVPCGSHSGKRPALWEFGDRPVHLLGGSPQAQMRVAAYLNVVSIDCSMTASMARRKCAFWSPKRIHGAKNRWWVQMQEIGEGEIYDAPYAAFGRSCTNVIEGWQLWEQGEL